MEEEVTEKKETDQLHHTINIDQIIPGEGTSGIGWSGFTTTGDLESVKADFL